MDDHHVLPARHHVQEAEGVAAESFHPAPQASKRIAPRA